MSNDNQSEIKGQEQGLPDPDRTLPSMDFAGFAEMSVQGAGDSGKSNPDLTGSSNDSSRPSSDIGSNDLTNTKQSLASFDLTSSPDDLQLNSDQKKSAELSAQENDQQKIQQADQQTAQQTNQQNDLSSSLGSGLDQLNKASPDQSPVDKKIDQENKSPDFTASVEVEQFLKSLEPRQNSQSFQSEQNLQSQQLPNSESSLAEKNPDADLFSTAVPDIDAIMSNQVMSNLDRQNSSAKKDDDQDNSSLQISDLDLNKPADQKTPPAQQNLQLDQQLIQENSELNLQLDQQTSELNLQLDQQTSESKSADNIAINKPSEEPVVKPSEELLSNPDTDLNVKLPLQSDLTLDLKPVDLAINTVNSSSDHQVNLENPIASTQDSQLNSQPNEIPQPNQISPQAEIQNQVITQDQAIIQDQNISHQAIDPSITQATTQASTQGQTIVQNLSDISPNSQSPLESIQSPIESLTQLPTQTLPANQDQDQKQTSILTQNQIPAQSPTELSTQTQDQNQTQNQQQNLESPKDLSSAKTQQGQQKIAIPQSALRQQPSSREQITSVIAGQDLDETAFQKFALQVKESDNFQTSQNQLGVGEDGPKIDDLQKITIANDKNITDQQSNHDSSQTDQSQVSEKSIDPTANSSSQNSASNLSVSNDSSNSLKSANPEDSTGQKQTNFVEKIEKQKTLEQQSASKIQGFFKRIINRKKVQQISSDDPKGDPRGTENKQKTR
ncbi:MAG: hypothetical protein ACKO47_04125 [Alphaproteobacteria bacterium]